MQILLLLIGILVSSYSLNVKYGHKSLIGGPIFLKFHRYVEIEADSKVKVKLDFIPQNPTDPKTLRSLLMNNWEPATVRVEYYENFDDKEVLRTCERIQANFSQDMNLFTNNCYHFAKYARSEIERIHLQ